MLELGKIIGLKVISIKGYREGNSKIFEPKYILFDDGKTYLDLEEQDYYSFHDCSSTARQIRLYESPTMWEIIKSDNTKYPNANSDL